MIEYLSAESTGRIAVAAAAVAIAIVIKKFFPRKLKRIAGILPFLSGIAISFIWSLAANGDTPFGTVIKEGTDTGGAATVIYALIMSVFDKDTEAIPFDALIIEGLIAGYVADEQNAEAAEACAEILRKNSGEARTELLKQTLLDYSDNMTPIEADMMVKMIENVLSAVK